MSGRGLQDVIVTVDVAIFSVQAGQLMLLLHQRKNAPCKGEWALPGGYVHDNEDADLATAARRTLGFKAGVDLPYMEQVTTVGNAQRDPRGWCVTVLYLATMSPKQVEQYQAQATVDNTQWLPLADVVVDTPLAFDHKGLIAKAKDALLNKAANSTVTAMLLPEEFTLNEYQHLYELVTEQSLDTKSFRRRILATDLLEETGEMQPGKTRSAKLYRVAAEVDTQSPTMFTRPTIGQRS